ncbi:hypothetical protein INT48_006027, partial [Thamnidium elegans]
GCCGSNKPKWKREIVPDHKFENVNLDAFYDPSCTTRFGYSFVFIAVLKTMCVILADLYTAVSLLVIGQTTVTPAIPTEYSKWIFLICIMVSYLLIIWDLIKSRRILASRDISGAFTSAIVNKYLSIKDYRYYCLFKSINANSKGINNYAFFIFFTLKGWKRLLLAEAPRQVINIVTLQALVPQWLKIRNGQVTFNNDALGADLMQQILTGTMAFSVVVFAISFSLVCIAAVLYIPLFCHIRGNLKEYCCHKVDKRISEILRRQGQGRRNKRVHPEVESLISEKSYMRPLMAQSNSSSPSVASSSVDCFEKSPYFKFNELNSGLESSYFNQPKSPQQFMEKGRPKQHAYQNRRYLTPTSETTIPYQNNNTANSSIPSSTCVNEHRYQHRKYPRGY